MVTTKLNLSMTEPSVRQIYAKQGDTGRVLDISLDQTPEDGTLRILRPDGVEVTNEAVTGGEISESGETVSFESLTEADVTELTVGIEPVQDLHGYDYPWPAGGGKNLLQNTGVSKEENGIVWTVNADGTIHAQGTASGNSLFVVNTFNFVSGTSYILNGCPAGGAASTKWQIQILQSLSWSAINTDIGEGTTISTLSGQYYIRCVVRSGNTVNFDFKPMIRLSSVSDATFEPYSNICPITGHDEVTVTRTGKFYVGADYESGDGYVDNGFLKSDNTITENSAYYVTRFFPITPDTDCLLNVVNYYNAPSICFYDSSKSFIRGESFSNRIRFTVHTPSNCAYARMSIHKAIKSQMGVYDNYSTYTTSLGQTVYGGTLDLVSGVLTVTHGIQDLGALSWTKDTSAVRFYASLPSAKKPSSNDATFNGISSMFVAKSLNYLYSRLEEDGLMALSVGGVLSVRDISLMSGGATAFATAMSGQSVVYELATPTVIDLTPQQIKTLVGTNNVWASSGDIVSIKFTYGGLLSELPSDATSVVGKCYCDVEQNGVSSMPFTLNVKKNERES